MKKTLTLISLLLITACTPAMQSYKHYLGSKGVKEHTANNFEHCRGYGCKYIDPIEFSETDWDDITPLFTPPAQSAKAERDQLRTAISIFENKAGKLAGTSGDIHGTFIKIGDHQLDCVDESTNTTIYLSLLEKRGFLHHHRIEPPSVRLPLIHAGRWPHQTAVISEIETGELFAVDSWFHDNGHPPEIVTLKAWKEGYKPEKNE